MCVCRVAGVEKYTNAVKLLFDPDNAQIDLLSLEIKVTQTKICDTIGATFRVEVKRLLY